MKYIQCPEVYKPKPTDYSVFLAGGITGCDDWQKWVVEELKTLKLLKNLVIINPRRENWNSSIKNEEQITWEFEHIRKCNVVCFYFTPPTLNPITLLEYGKLLVSNKDLIVHVHPDYARKDDVCIQTKLERPFQYISNNNFEEIPRHISSMYMVYHRDLK